jgi:hypothetical protein
VYCARASNPSSINEGIISTLTVTVTDNDVPTVSILTPALSIGVMA